MPIAYFLTKGTGAEKKVSLVNECLIALANSNFKILTLTCDGTVTNISTLRLLGCNLQFDTLKPYFEHPATKEKVFAFLDPPHILKLVRNTFGKCKVMKDDAEKEINWKYLEELHKLQTLETFHLSNKLTIKHMYFQKQKMKVKLAAQLISKSVADVLTFCKN